MDCLYCPRRWRTVMWKRSSRRRQTSQRGGRGAAGGGESGVPVCGGCSPAYNEEESVARVVRSVPRQIQGIDRVAVLVYDDGSTDRTSEEARGGGGDYVLRHTRNRGLAVTFRDALDAALHLGADVIVNTDADDHYDQSRIPDLVEPVVEGEADIVVGSRALGELRDMPFSR